MNKFEIYLFHGVSLIIYRHRNEERQNDDLQIILKKIVEVRKFLYFLKDIDNGFTKVIEHFLISQRNVNEQFFTFNETLRYAI